VKPYFLITPLSLKAKSRLPFQLARTHVNQNNILFFLGKFYGASSHMKWKEVLLLGISNGPYLLVHYGRALPNSWAIHVSGLSY
jgi:hypothetical protein